MTSEILLEEYLVALAATFKNGNGDGLVIAKDTMNRLRKHYYIPDGMNEVYVLSSHENAHKILDGIESGTYEPGSILKLN